MCYAVGQFQIMRLLILSCETFMCPFYWARIGPTSGRDGFPRVVSCCAVYDVPSGTRARDRTAKLLLLQKKNKLKNKSNNNLNKAKT